jgi:hypothetical protein
MKLLLRILLSLVVLLVIAAVFAYADGASLPEDHTATVTGTISAPPDAVFARIVDVGAGAAWRPAVKKVTVLAPDNGRDRWVEDLGHGQTMTFLALDTAAPGQPSGTGRREVFLDDPKASYGGTWVYTVAPGPSPNTTALTITETGFIHPPLYRFMMRHVLGMTYNLDQYLKDMRNAFTS